MSDKHLTELPWKTLVVKQGVKDIGLQKALATYAKFDATKEPEKGLEALKEISELALKLKKTYAAKDEVAAHLDEVVKEVKKTTPVLEARIKSALAAKPGGAAKPGAKDEDEDEAAAAEFKKDLKKQMASALAQVKIRAPGDPGQGKEPKPQLKFMAYLAGKSSAVIVAPKVGAATKKLLPEIAGGASGGKFVQGECIFEKNAHTFVLDQVPGGLAKMLATALNTETGQKYKVCVRSTDGSVALDSDTDVDPAAATGDPASLFNERFKALLSDIKAAAGTPSGDQAKARAGEAAQFAQKKEFAQANQLLGRIENLLKTAAGEKAVPPTETVAASWRAEQAKVVAKLQEEIKAVVATKDPLAVQAELELKAVLRQLNGKLETQRQAGEMDRYLKQDEVVAAICEMVFDLKTPLLKVLEKLTPLLPA